MKICFHCTHHCFDHNETNCLERNLCDIATTDPVDGGIAMQFCYLKNINGNCSDYDPRNKDEVVIKE